MKSKLVEMLHLDLEPVGIYFGNTETACDISAEPGKRNCLTTHSWREIEKRL